MRAPSRQANAKSKAKAKAKQRAPRKPRGSRASERGKRKLLEMSLPELRARMQVAHVALEHLTRLADRMAHGPKEEIDECAAQLEETTDQLQDLVPFVDVTKLSATPGFGPEMIEQLAAFYEQYDRDPDAMAEEVADQGGDPSELAAGREVWERYKLHAALTDALETFFGHLQRLRRQMLRELRGISARG